MIARLSSQPLRQSRSTGAGSSSPRHFWSRCSGSGWAFTDQASTYLVALKARHGWSTEELSSAITVYYILDATLLFLIVGPLFDRWGARVVVAIGTVAMACGVVLLTLITSPWQVYASFGVMSLGWAAMSGAAINIIVAPWFERRRGLALSWAMNGGSAGGVLLAPLDSVDLAVRLRCRPRYGGRTDARLSHPGDDAAASAKTPQ